MPRGKNPNSVKQLADHAAAKKKSGEPVKPISVGLTKEAIASLDTAATALGISRSELVERYARSLESEWQAELAKLEERYHVKITTPFEQGEPYFAGASPLGQSGFNGRPDYEAQGVTLQEAVLNLARVVTASKEDSKWVEAVKPTVANQCPICGKPAKNKYCSVRCSNTAQARKSREVRAATSANESIPTEG
jgi:hypothetical protein